MDAQHQIDDLEQVRTKALRTIKPLSPMLADALHALEAGRYDVVREFMQRVQDDLDVAVTVLRNHPTT